MVTFDRDQLNLIFEDQRDALENIHIGENICAGLHICPPEHFGNEDIEEILLRQKIMQIILNDLEV